MPDDDYPIILKRQSEGMYLLQRVRDESHRFAITYHRQTRRKGALRSALDDIPGIGHAKAENIYQALHSSVDIASKAEDALRTVKSDGNSPKDEKK